MTSNNVLWKVMSSDERFRQSFADKCERDYVVQPKNGIVMACLSTRTMAGKADEQRPVDDCERDGPKKANAASIEDRRRVEHVMGVVLDLE